MNVPLAFLGIGPMEMLIVGAVAVLLFGKRLPEVGRSLGKSLVEFKKGIREIETGLENYTSESSRVSDDREVVDYEEATAPMFEPPTAEPKSEQVA